MAVERSSIVIEEYLQAIYAFSRGDLPVKSVQLAERLASSPSTVHATLGRMQRDGFIEMGYKKQIALPPKGLLEAEPLTRRHQLVETFLCDHLGIPWHEVHQHAHVLEHGLTPLVEERLAEFLGFPDNCPHGSPIPGGLGRLPEQMVFLDQLPVGQEFSVVLIQEALEDQPELMEFLERHHLTPGEKLQLRERVEATNSLILNRDNQPFSLPLSIAALIGVVVGA